MSEERRSGSLVSIICAAYNAERTIAQTIRSVLAQEHAEWELLIGSDRSTDGTEAVVRTFTDPRIRLTVFPERRGPSATRGDLLRQATGDFFCFLDSDDVMPPRSIIARLSIMIASPGTSFVDGVVEIRNGDLSRTIAWYRPTFRGEPLPRLMALDGSCFLGNTWLVRREPDVDYRFDPNLNHGEDLLFYMDIARGRLYDHTPETVLWYRRTGDTLMTDLRGLENGYAYLYLRIVRDFHATIAQRVRFKLRIIRIMVLGHLKHNGAVLQAARVVWRYVFLSASSSNTRR